LSEQRDGRSFAPLSAQGARPPSFAARFAAARQENVSSSHGANVSVFASVSESGRLNEAGARGTSARTVLGVRISGCAHLRDDAAITKFNRECTMDWRCTRISIDRALRKKVHGLDKLESLIHHRRRIDGDFRAHFPDRMAQRLIGCDTGKLIFGLVKKRPAGRGEIESFLFYHDFRQF
jgi:hypothetical protein